MKRVDDVLSEFDTIVANDKKPNNNDNDNKL